MPCYYFMSFSTTILGTIGLLKNKLFNFTLFCLFLQGICLIADIYVIFQGRTGFVSCSRSVAVGAHRVQAPWVQQ